MQIHEHLFEIFISVVMLGIVPWVIKVERTLSSIKTSLDVFFSNELITMKKDMKDQEKRLRALETKGS